jgi:hypothetical protein
MQHLGNLISVNRSENGKENIFGPGIGNWGCAFS